MSNPTAVERIVAVIEASDPSTFITLPLSDADTVTDGRKALDVAYQIMMNRGYAFGAPYRNAEAGTVTMRRLSRKSDKKTDQTITLPTTATNYKQEQEKIEWPKGRPIVECGSVYLINQRKGVFAVVYGLQVTKELSRDRAAIEFGQCVMHQAECAGLIN